MARMRVAWKLQAAIAKALGIDVSQTTRIVLDIGVDGPPRVRVSQYLTVEQEDAIVRIFEASQYEEVA